MPAISFDVLGIQVLSALYAGHYCTFLTSCDIRICSAKRQFTSNHLKYITETGNNFTASECCTFSKNYSLKIAFT